MPDRQVRGSRADELMVALILARTIITGFAALRSVYWLRKSQPDVSPPSSSGLPRIAIVIPALDEQNRILPTLDYFAEHFLNAQTQLVVVTTAREAASPMGSTKQVVADWVELTGSQELVECLDYNGPGRRIASQLNFALKSLAPDVEWVAIYNADSRPHPQTFVALTDTVGRPKVVQQSSLFIGNWPPGKRGSRALLGALALLQSRWTLAHEIPRLRRQWDGCPSFVRRASNTHVVGHGLIVRPDILQRLGGFPIDTVVEDTHLGFRMRQVGIAIAPVTTLEAANSPETIRGMCRQRIVWAFGPLAAPVYLARAWRGIGSVGKLRSLVLAIQTAGSAVAWMAHGPLLVVTAWRARQTDSHRRTLFILGLLAVGGPLDTLVGATAARRLTSVLPPRTPRPTHLQTFVAMLASPFVVVLHCAAPFLAIAWRLGTALIGGKIAHFRTDG